MKEASYRRLAIAVIISALLHAWMFSDLDLSLPAFKREMHTIEARLELPKVVLKPVKEPQPEIAKTKEVEPAPPPRQPEPPEVNAPEEAPPIIEQPAPPPPADVIPAPTEPTVENLEPSIETPPPVEALPQPEDKGLVINENAYRYVETYFDVRTKVDGPAEGKAKAVFNLMDGGRYQLNFLIHAEGLVGLFIPDLLQTSEGLLIKTGLQPLNYLYQFGDKKDKDRKAVFDWQAKTLQLTNNKGVASVPLLDDTQDMLSFMYQFMYVPPLQKMQLSITNGKKLREYDYAFEGEELVFSPLGEIKSMHIVHNDAESDEKIELWLAVDYQYLPVKIRKFEKDGKVYEFVATRIETTRPTVNPP